MSKQPPYEVQTVKDGLSESYRITETSTDSRIGTCHMRQNADLIVAALNAYAAPRGYTSNPIALRLHEIGLQLEGTGHEEIVLALGVAEREIERLTDLHRPIPVSERLPTHIYTVLGFVVGPSELVCGEPFWETVVWNGKRGKWQVGGYGDDDIDVEVTLWMDLPPVPDSGVQS